MRGCETTKGKGVKKKEKKRVTRKKEKGGFEGIVLMRGHSFVRSGM